MKKTEKTKNEIINAFWVLIQEIGLEKITVKNISQKANINRSTFYNYFFDINDLTNQIENELIENTKKEALKVFNKNKKENINSLPTFFTEVFAKSNDKVFVLLSSKGDPSFMSKIKKELVPFACTLNILDDSIPNFEYVVTFVFSSAIGLISYWYESGKNIPIQDFSNLAQILVSSGTVGLTKLNNKKQEYKKTD